MKSLVALFAIGLIAVIALAEPPVEKATTRPTEPPQEFTLEVDGKPVAIEAGTPLTARVGDKDVTLKLTPKPDRLLKLPGVSFRYPTQHGFEHDAEDETVLQWTLDGNSNTIIITRAAVKSDPAELVKDTLDSIASQFNKRDIKRGKGELSLGGKKHTSTKLQVTVIGHKIAYEAVGFNVDDSTYVIILQDTPNDDGTTSDETQQVMDLLDKTFKTTPPPSR